MTPETKAMLWTHYTPARFPVLLAMSGPWEIRGEAAGDYCAAIPTDRTSGHLPSGYGTRADVSRQLRAGTIQPPAMTPETRGHLERVTDLATDDRAAGMTAPEAIAAAVAALAEDWPAITAAI